MHRAKMPTGCANCCKTRTGRENLNHENWDSLLPSWLDRSFRYRRLGADFGDIAIGQLPIVAIFFPYIDDKKFAAVGLALRRRFLETFKFHHRRIAQIGHRHLPRSEE